MMCNHYAGVSGGRGALRGIVQPAFIATLKDHLPAHPGYYGEMVWILMMLEKWLQAQPQALPSAQA